jgi:outer membrane protein assembly factor BamB
MKSSHSFKIVKFLCLFLFTAGWIFAEDWPQWRGPNRDAKVSDFKAPAAWPEKLTETWKVTVGTGDATPALAGDKLYVFARQGEEEVTLCLKANTGEQVWKDSYAAQAVTGAAARHPGPRGSVAAAGGKVITMGVGGVLSCLDAATGKVEWRKDPYPKIVPRFFTSVSPIIVDDMVISHLGGQGNGAIIAFNLADGQEKWKWAGEGPDYASPVLLTAGDTQQIVTLTEKSIVGIGLADGKLLWQLPFVPQGRAYNAATPIVDGQTVIYTGAGRGTFAVKIEKEGETFVPKPLWSNPEIATQYNTPVLRDGRVFGMSNSGNLFCLNAATGQTDWVDPNSLDRGGFGTIVDAGSVLAALPSSSEMIVYKPSEKTFEPVARIKVSATPTYAYPIFAGNRIFIRDQDTVALYKIE